MPRLKTRKATGPAIVTSIKPDTPSRVLDTKPEYDIVTILEGYRNEAEYARLAGPNSRDLTWLMHWDLYWNRYDFSKKAAWQAREVLPEFPQYIDRFAAAMRMALASGDFFDVEAQGDENNDLATVIRKFMKITLGRIGRNATGQPTSFLDTFEDAMKMGALSMLSGIVTYKDDGKGGYTALDLEDPYNIWLDPTGRNLYRIRRVEMDLHELKKLGTLKDEAGLDIYDPDAIANASSAIIAIMRAEQQKRTGTGQWLTGNRRPVVLHEYYGTIIDPEGNVIGENVLAVVVNNRWLIRGPEVNPFWHGQDFMVTRPVITVPLAPYGRSYAENFAQIARTFNEMTNLLLDAVLTSSMKVYAGVPGNLEDPAQFEEGIYPNVLFRLLEGQKPEEFLMAVDMGKMAPEAFQIWSALKKELQEGAAFNELTLGNLAPKGRTSATEIGTAENNSTSYIRSIASNIEVGWLEPVLTLIWKTSIQHLSTKDTEMRDALGDKWFGSLLKGKRKFAEYNILFRCRGISTLLLKRQKLQEFLQFLQVVGANQLLTQAMLEQYGTNRIFAYLEKLMDIPTDELTKTPREVMLDQLKQEQAQQQQQSQELALKSQQAAQQVSPEQEEASDFRKHARKAILGALLPRVTGGQPQQPGAPGGGGQARPPAGPGGAPGPGSREFSG